MLALATGWDESVLGSLSARFRAACHWALYVRALIGPDGIPSTEVPRDAGPEVRVAAAKLSIQLAKLRESVYPEDDDGDA